MWDTSRASEARYRVATPQGFSVSYASEAGTNVDLSFAARSGAGERCAEARRRREAPGGGRSVEQGVGNGVPDKFADCARFDDMFGASRIFTDGTARQRKKRPRCTSRT